MKRKMVLLAMVFSLLIVLSTTVGVMADKPTGLPHEPHDAGCAAYCARAIVHELVEGDEIDGIWAPVDDDGDGKVEKCLRELVNGTTMCIKSERGVCPEWLDDPDYPHGRCVLKGDGWGFWCRLMHGEDTHTRGHGPDMHGRGH
jgi:hypothetical protein